MSGLPDELDVHYDQSVENETDNGKAVVDKEPVLDTRVHGEGSNESEVNEEVEDEHEEEISYAKGKGYKVVDHLDEDEPIPLDGTFKIPVIRNGKEEIVTLYPQKTPKWIVVSCMTPDGVANSRLHATKIRSPALDDYDVADAVAKWRRDTAPDGDCWSVGVQSLYVFTPIDESDKYVETMKYGNAKQQRLMQQQKLDELNDLAGKKKELLRKKRQGFERRKKDRILTAQTEKSSASKKSKKNKKKPQKNSRAVNYNRLKERMKKMVAKKNQAAAKEDEKKRLEEKEREQKENLEQRRELLSEKEKHVNKIKENMANIKAALRN